MDILNRYGVRRVAEIAAKVAKCRAALPVATEVPEVAPIEAQDAQRAPFVIEFPRERESHLKAQRRMFAAIKGAGLPMNLSRRIDGINALLGTAITSSTHLTPAEMHAVADAIEAARFDADWNLIEPLELDAPFLCDAPPESEPIETQTTPAPLESLDELAMGFDLAQMRKADRARALNDLRARRVLLETQLIELDRAMLCA